LFEQPGIPWEILYERPYHGYDSKRTKLCSDFRTHGLKEEDCPNRGDLNVVCPHGFWGYRYIIEQLPCRVEHGTAPPTRSLPIQIRNQTPLHLAALVDTTLSRFPEHWKNLSHLLQGHAVELQQIDSFDEVESFVSVSGAKADILYFYAHGGKNEMGASYLKIGDGHQLTQLNWNAWQVDLNDTQPLIIINTCDSADYTPDDYDNLIQMFSQRGGVGVIATQCQIREMLADAFMSVFLQTFLRQETVGRALSKARHWLLNDKLDPRGLVYSLFTSADIRLAQVVIED
jgi:hypothetical protein